MSVAVVEERTFPSDELIFPREDRLPEGVRVADDDGVVHWERAPYEPLIRQYVVEGTLERLPGLGFPGASRPEPEMIYDYLFAVWPGGSSSEASISFYSHFPAHIVLYYVPRWTAVSEDTVHARAVSLHSLRVLDFPARGVHSGIVNTADDSQEVTAPPSLRDESMRGDAIELYFAEWEAWTNPPTHVPEARRWHPDITYHNPRLDFQVHTRGWAAAFYRPFPEPPPRDTPDVELPPRRSSPIDERILRLAEEAGPDSIGRAIQLLGNERRHIIELERLLRRRLGKQ